MHGNTKVKPISYSYKITGKTDFVYFNVKLNMTTKCKVARSHGETLYIVQQIFQKNWRHLNIVGARQGTRSKVHAKNPQILGCTIPNKVAWD
jgi:rRNA processing protein Gar1